MMTKTAHGYRLGRTTLELASAHLRSIQVVPEFLDICTRHARREDTLQLAALGPGLEVFYLARHEGNTPVRLISNTGRALPASCTATGKALLARLDDADLTRRLAAAGPLRALTDRSITSTEQLIDEVRALRHGGIAVDDEETALGVVCLAVYVGTAPPDNEELAISISLPASAADPVARQDAAVRVNTIADELRQRVTLSGQPSPPPLPADLSPP